MGDIFAVWGGEQMREHVQSTHVNTSQTEVMKTWNVLEWTNRPEKVRSIALICPRCATEAELEIGEMPGGSIIAAAGLNLIFDPPGYKPPENSMPDRIRCRSCRTLFVSDPEVADVR